MNPWQSFFDRYADRYDAEVFTQNTQAEVPFLIEHLAPPAGGAILDVGCGTGRHSVALAELGYRMTGVDISQKMLDNAARRAQQADVEVEWICCDAVDFSRERAFDAAICLCEGAMCLLTEEDDPLQRDQTILHNVSRSLRPGGKFILNVLNASRVLRSADDEDIRAGKFDPVNLTELSDAAQLLDDESITTRLRERYYTAPEIRRLVQAAGMTVQGVYGGTAGNWGLRPVELDEYELMVIAEKA